MRRGLKMVVRFVACYRSRRCTRATPELNPAENVWQYLRQTYLSNRVFEDYDAIIAAGSKAWNRLIESPWKIMSIGMRQWAHSGQC